jgi:hypothetical protein
VSRASSGAMIIDADHLRVVTERNVHLVRWPNDSDHLESAVREAATRLDHHLALLDGRALHTEQDVLCALADAFHFPSSMREAAVSDWNVTADFLWELPWLSASGSERKGVVALLRDPEPFMRSNLLQLAFVIDALGTRSQSAVRAGIPLHVIVGPLPEDYRYEVFLNCLEVSKYFCVACQSVDQDSVID